LPIVIAIKAILNRQEWFTNSEMALPRGKEMSRICCYPIGHSSMTNEVVFISSW